MKKFYKLAAAISLALAAGNAAADLVTPQSDSASSILFTAVDENTASANYGATFVLDLAVGNTGLNYASFLNGAETSQLSWNLASYAPFAAFEADNSKLQWSVLGGQAYDGLTPASLSTFGLLTTETGVASSFATGFTALNSETATGGNVAVQYANVNTYFDSNAITTNQAAIPSGSIQNIANLGSLQTDSSTLWANTGGIGSNTINFWLLQNDNASTRAGHTSPNVVTDIGSWTLNGNTLSYAPAGSTAVPVPGAVWMFLSGLVGVLGFKRRQQ
ncbi:MAG: PEP-CTERM sorting domain-containing protein [Methylomonas sp.]|jgi:hypothetical protein